MMFTQQTCQLHKREHVMEVNNPGDYCFAQADTAERVILSCPACGTVMSLSHEIKQRDPLTLSPSVVGPVTKPRDSQEQVLGPCGHHFWVVDGKAVDIT